MKNRFIVTIDGPAGSGKSTIAELLRKRDGFIHINSGLFYRAIGYLLGDDVNESSLSSLSFSFKFDSDILIVHNNEILNDKLNNEQVGIAASRVAKKGFVRDFVNNLIRGMAKKGKFVIDGRDCGSVIFPSADVKIFLEASVNERARRRALQTNENFEDVVKKIKERDEQDRNRKIAPLIVPEGAVVINTDKLGIEGVYLEVKKEIERVYENRDF
ncbi:(d)CMP kinase [Hippea jasoniae]|uniref:(d)CMP kinase n=1 Tax=Hippea jasoniae TaxID=944479 RepID=UPI00054E199A|nr:(d)CMP kinase [Hippea jasoniae]